MGVDDVVDVGGFQAAGCEALDDVWVGGQGLAGGDMAADGVCVAGDVSSDA